MARQGIQMISPRAEPREQHEPKSDPLDQLLKGLQIAQSVTGISSDLSKLENYKEQTRAAQLERQGYLTQKQLIDQQKNYEVTDPGAPGSQTYKVLTGDDETKDFREVGLRYPTKTAAQTKYERQVVKGPNGKLVVGSYNPAEGKMVPLKGDELEAPPRFSDEYGDRQTKKDWGSLGKALVAGTASSRSDLGRNQATITNADKILTLGKQGEKQEGGLDKRQIHEAAIASANLVAGGVGAAQSTVEALVPHTSDNLTANIEEWLTSDPKGVNQQAFVKRMMETASREKHLSEEKIKTIKSDILQQYSDLAVDDPARWDKTIKYHFGKDAKFDEFGHYVPKEYVEEAAGGTKNLAHPPGSLVETPEGTFRVGDDGDTLIPVSAKQPTASPVPAPTPRPTR